MFVPLLKDPVRNSVFSISGQIEMTDNFFSFRAINFKGNHIDFCFFTQLYSMLFVYS